MAWQLGSQTIAIHILSNISRSKDNQTMKFGQLIEYNMRNILRNVSEKLYTKCGGEIIPSLFSKNQNWVYLWINSLKVLYSLFLLYGNLSVIEI